MTREGFYKGDSYTGGPNVTAGFPPPFRVSRSHEPSGSQYPNRYHQSAHESQTLHEVDQHSTQHRPQELEPCQSLTPESPQDPNNIHNSSLCPTQRETRHYTEIGHQNSQAPRQANVLTPEAQVNGGKMTYENKPTDKPTRHDQIKGQPIRCTKDEKRLREADVNLPLQDVIGLPMEEFNSLLSRAKLTESQQELCRDVRKRGKNKWAAQNCRKRKIGQLDELQEKFKIAELKRNKLREDHQRLIAEYEIEANKLKKLTDAVLQYHQKSPHEYLVQVQEGDMVLIVEIGLVKEEDRVPQPVKNYQIKYTETITDNMNNLEGLDIDEELKFLDF